MTAPSETARLAGTIVVLTGGGRGIGAAVARAVMALVPEGEEAPACDLPDVETWR